eukprot:362478-Chlamydomonas_euryale.AAC.16
MGEGERDEGRGEGDEGRGDWERERDLKRGAEKGEGGKGWGPSALFRLLGGSGGAEKEEVWKERGKEKGTGGVQ